MLLYLTVCMAMFSPVIFTSEKYRAKGENVTRLQFDNGLKLLWESTLDNAKF